MAIKRDSPLLIPHLKGRRSNTFPLVRILHERGHEVAVYPSSSKEYRDFVLSVNEQYGQAWSAFYAGVSYILKRGGVPFNAVGRFCVSYHMQHDRSRLKVSYLDASLVKAGLFCFHDGNVLSDYVNGFRPSTGSNYMGVDDWAAVVHLVSLFGVAFFLSYRVLSKEDMFFKKATVEEFNAVIEGSYLLMEAWERDIVGQYMWRWVGKTEPDLGEFEVPAHDKSSAKLLREAKRPQREAEIMASIKDMGTWTEADFWSEMTQLYVKCKTEEDVKSMKQILELKAKSMGIMDDSKPVTNNFFVMQERAMNTLAAMGIVTRRVVHEQ